MRTKLSKLEVIVMCFLSLIPWPGPSVFKISCSRESACVVRKIIQSKWIPILDKYQVKIPLECPFHPLRDIFGPQQMAKKQNRPSQWTCGFCGKSFYEEKYLDMHFENRHKSKINMAEDAICLADYCDIMRCEVLLAKDSTLSFGDSNTMSTDIEIWNEATAYRTALQQTGRRDLAKISNSRTSFLPLLSRFQKQSQKNLPKTSSSSSGSSAATSTQHQGLGPSSAGGARNKNDDLLKKSPKFNNCIKLDIKKNNKKNNVISKYNKIKNKIINQENGNANDNDVDDDGDEDLDENSFKLNNEQKTNTNDKHKLKSYTNIGDDIEEDDEDEDLYDEEDDENGDDDDDGDDNEDDDDDDEDDEDEQDINSTSPCSANLVDSSLPPINRKHKKILKQQKKIQTDCKTEDLEVLKRRCEILVRDCIVGLLLQLSNADFRKMEDELNRSVCWYLTCDRYWEDGPNEQKAFPWGLVLVLVMILSLGVCFCYYIIWILFDSDDNSISKNFNYPQYHHHQHHSPSHQQQHYQQQQHQNQFQPQQQQQQFSSSSLMVPTDQKGIGGSGGSGNAGGNTVAGGAASSSSNTSSSNFPLDQQQYPIGYTEDVYAAPNDFNDVAQNEHYIYVTYPPELKRRLFESCYNRTTRL